MEETAPVIKAPISKEEFERIKAKRRRKVFVKWLKRVMVGPLLGLWMAIISFNIFNTSLVFSMILLMTLTCVGLLAKFRYIKYVYISFVAGIYILLISNVMTN